MIRWKKKNGNEIETTEDKVTVDYMKSLGCEIIEGPAKAQDDPPAETVEISEADLSDAPDAPGTPEPTKEAA